MAAPYDEGYTDGYDEARAELLLKVRKWLRRRDTKQAMTDRIDAAIAKARANGRWPDGFTDGYD